MKNLLFIPVVFMYCWAHSQNLVYNPDFESFNNCPPACGVGVTSYMNYADHWDYYQHTPDYFNVCSPGDADVPNNHYGVQTAASGVAYGGFCAFQDDFTTNGREGILGSLTDTLDIGVKYYCSFKMNLAGGSTWACNNVGIVFHAQFLREPYWFQAGYSHILNSNIVSDTVNWITFSGSFIADSNYMHFSITNHFNDANTNLFRMKPGVGVAYYYVDDVCVSTDSMTCNLKTIHRQVARNPTINVHPNPSASVANFYSDVALHNAALSIHNAHGQVVKHIEGISGKSYALNVQDISSGLYFYSIMHEDGILKTGRLIIERK